MLFSTAVSMAYYADFAKDTASNNSIINFMLSLFSCCSALIKEVDGIDDLTANIYNRIGNSLGAAAVSYSSYDVKVYCIDH